MWIYEVVINVLISRVIHIMRLNLEPLCYLTLRTFNPEKLPFACVRLIQTFVCVMTQNMERSLTR